MSDNGKSQSEEYAPDPQVDLLLEQFATAVPAETLLDGLEARVSARLAKEIPVAAGAAAAAKPADAPAGEKAAAAAPAAAQTPVAAPGILIPQARRSKAPIFIALGGIAAAGLAAAVVFLVMRPPETEVVTRTVEEVTYVPVERTSKPMTAEPEPETAEMVAMVDTTADGGLGDTGEEIGAPTGTTDDDEYVPEDDTARLMAEARAKLKSAKGKKKTSKAKGASDDDAGDDILDDSALPATSAPEPTPPPAADPAADPGKAGAFEKDLEELLARKKAAAAAKTKTAAPEPTKRLLKKADVKKEINRASRKIGSCGAIDSGTVTVTWFVEGSGAPTKVSAKAPHSSTALGACVTNIIKGLKFPSHDEEPKKVSYPFVVKSD